MSSATLEQRVWTIEGVLRWATDDFRARHLETPRLDAELLLARALSATRIDLIVQPKRVLEAEELTAFRAFVKRRRAHEPVAYILGEREFYGRSFRVDRRVLIPRPDSETLVDVALERTRAVSMSMRALDLCTGSGCVAITLARQRPTSSITATDVDPGALALARDNALRLGAYNVAFRLGDLFAAVAPVGRPAAAAPGVGRPAAATPEAPFDLVAANPPYIASSEIEHLQQDVRDFEPRDALDGGKDGLAVVRRIIAEGSAHLVAGGVLAVEVGAGHAGAVASLFDVAGFVRIEVRRDYAGIERVVSGAAAPEC